MSIEANGDNVQRLLWHRWEGAGHGNRKLFQPWQRSRTKLWPRSALPLPPLHIPPLGLEFSFLIWIRGRAWGVGVRWPDDHMLADMSSNDYLV
jgi:hypothetical protein